VNTADLTWFKSSYSGDAGGDCLEVAVEKTSVHVRDSKTDPGLTLALSPNTWTAFVRSQASRS